MRREDINPAAIVREAAGVRIAEQEAVAMWNNLNRDELRRLDTYREWGLRLIPIHNAKKGQGWDAWLKDKGIPKERASEAIRIAEGWKTCGRCTSKRDALKCLRENIFTHDSESSNRDPEIQAEVEKRIADDERHQTVPSLEATPPDPTGDAAEDVPPTALTDVDGLVLPEKARAAWECTAIEEFIEKVLRPTYAAITSLEGKPGTVHTNIKGIRTRLHAAANMLRSSKLAHRCKECGGNGCKTCKQIGAVSKAIWSELRKREKARDWNRRKGQRNNSPPE
jgi:hypothetical protein